MRFTISKACILWNVDPKTLKKGLSDGGHEIKRNATFTALQICEAVHGDLEREKVLETRERRKSLEKDNAERDGILVPMEQVQKMYTDALLPIRQALLALPSECATRCNPTDPPFARSALQSWVDSTLKRIRDELPK